MISCQKDKRCCLEGFYNYELAHKPLVNEKRDWMARLVGII